MRIENVAGIQASNCYIIAIGSSSLYNKTVQVENRSRRREMGTTTYSHLRQNLADVWDKVEDSQEPLIVERRGHQAMAILPAEELEGLRETAHLLRSPRNAARLLTALQRALRGNTKSVALEDLRAQLGLDEDK